MKAKEICREYNGKVIKLSFGTGFIFCGAVDGDLINLLNRADRYFLRRAKHQKVSSIERLDSATKRLAETPGRIKALEDNLEFCEGKIAELNDEFENVIDKEEKRRIIKDLNEFKDTVKELNGDEKHEGLIAIEKARLEYLKKRVPALKAAIANLSTYIDEYVSLAEREVIDTYDSVDRTDICKIDRIIICEGKEDGKYWTIKEYETDTRRCY